MYYEKFYPFYTTCADSVFCMEEIVQEEEYERMKACYPRRVRGLQKRVKDACDYLDYEGSRLYDEYPDEGMLCRMCQRIRQQMAEDAENLMGWEAECLEELIQVLLYQEIAERRCRRYRYRNHMKR